MTEWHDLFVATAGSAGGLIGLLFVGISINLQKIISSPNRASRGLVALIFLILIFIVSLLFLIPGQSMTTTGLEILLIVSIAITIVIKMDIGIYKGLDLSFRKKYKIYIYVNIIICFSYLMCAIFLITVGENGMYWIIPAIILSFTKAIWDAWVLLVKIHL